MAARLTARSSHRSERTRVLAWVGALCGALVALIVWWPAQSLAHVVHAVTRERILLVQPAGTLWNGSARLMASGGPDSADRIALPDRLQWRIRPEWHSGGPGLRVELEQGALLTAPLALHLQPGWGSMALQLGGAGDAPIPAIALPARWLSGWGAPWNTLQLSGRLTLQIEHLRMDWRPSDGLQVLTSLRLVMQNIASRVSTLPLLGHYELRVQGGPRLALSLQSHPGSALQMQGQGQWAPGSRVEFRGQATAAEGREAALANLLNIIGRRDGPRSVIAL